MSTVTTCYSAGVVFGLKENPAPCDQPPQRGNVKLQRVLKNFTIDSCPRFLNKRQSPISFKFFQPHQASNCFGFLPLMGA